MLLTCHHFPRAFSLPLVTITADESTMVKEELQQVEIGRPKMFAQREIVPQSRIEIFD